MQRRKPLFVIAVASSLLALSALAHAAFSGAEGAVVTFHATGPAGLEIVGTTHDLTVAESQGSIVVTVPLSNLQTGIELRDRHLKEKYLEVGKYPSATLTIPRASLRLPGSGAHLDGDAACTLQLHGQNHPVTVHYDANANSSAVDVSGRFHINISDFGITVPSYLGVTVKRDVDVDARFHALGS